MDVVRGSLSYLGMLFVERRIWNNSTLVPQPAAPGLSLILVMICSECPMFVIYASCLSGSR